MKDIGYYAGFLSAEDQEKINTAPIANLAAAITTLSDEFWQNHEDADDYSWLDIKYPESDRDKIALIRGLCDRIEVKLMEEEAK